MSGVGKSDRAPPRKRKESMDDQQPQFLRKAYYMIENCNPDIGTLPLSTRILFASCMC
jgi:hypothetical protein